MPLDLILAFIGFAFVSSITPGPNNLMLMTSGVNFGLNRTWPHIIGINIGFPVMQLLVGLGFGEIFERYPAVYSAMKVVGVLYMLWLAWKVANSGPIAEGETGGDPMGFWQAAAFQWVNPKAWVMVVSAIAAYTVPTNFVFSLVLTTVLYVIVGMPCSILWAAFGAAMRKVLRDPKTVRWFNIAMALLLVASLWPIVAEFLVR